ncbi:DEAD/DEAH box helicase [Dactylosporangium sp. AC04546]|uniref:DEAD/DEAH box helicase n=1 Tax=Dactylosporangium sp. AC04546 TaxID=2862460 RepID=UPI001EDEB8E4|nr:DEAD/DEAH box helicase [Dactylosporangium sp. AC04546]WVK85883.1 DEAD/DEAH box helicase [Dactylosporangium sp. AC04546]
MLVVHALWADARLCLWAEDGTLPAAPTRSRAHVAPHPFAVRGLSLDGDAGVAAVRTLRLPTRGGLPEPSPSVAAEPPTGRLELRDWAVETVAYAPDDAVGLLRSLGGLAGDDLVLGETTRWFAAVATFAAGLVARGRLLPGLVADEARWLPVLTGRDAAYTRQLALALPQAALDGDRPRARVLTEVLDLFVDAAARDALPAPRHQVPGAAGAWVARLTGRDRKVRGDLAVLRAELAAWQRDAVGGAVRACFRLVEPAEDLDTAPWRLEFALQAADEPSLVVGADRVWRSRGALTDLQGHIPAPQETLLAELGRASRLYPEIEDALRTARPAELELDAAGAHRMLSEYAPLLAAAGFGLLLPGWWRKASARLGLKLTARSSTATAPGTVDTGSALGLAAVVDYRWDLAIGDEPLTQDELRRLTDLKAPLVNLRGQWVELDPRRLAAGLEILRQRAEQTELTVADLLHLAGGADEGPGGLPVTGITADGWLGDLLSGETELRIGHLDVPDGFAGELRPYQQRGLNWLGFLEHAGLGGILADDMGLGKTVQLLALIAGKAPGPTLLVCPMSLVGNWQREAAKFAPGLRVHVHHGAERARGAAFRAAVAESDLVITTYSIAARDAAALKALRWHRLVLDEAQAVKNAATKQSVAVRQLPARHRVAVTGTPVENRLADLWSIMDFANPGLLGTATKFRERFAEPVERFGDEEAAARLRRITQPFVLRRVKTDKGIIADLPEKLEMDVLCNLTREQASLYQAVVDDMLARIERSEGIERRGLVLATMTRLKQVCNHPAQALRDGSRLAGRSGKLARLEEILDEVLAAGERALIFTQYAEFGGMLRAHLSARFGREVAFLHGGLPKASRDALVARFQSADPAAPPIFVLSLKAGGTGLTLTAANHVVHVDRWWNPAVEDQATDRAFRIGQRRAVQVRKFVTAGTVEEKIAAMIHDKRGLAARIVGAGEQWLTELSTTELRSLLALEPGAVVE